MNELVTSIKFYDHGDGQDGIFVLRIFHDKVSICLSLMENGDAEALIDTDVVQELIEALKVHRSAAIEKDKG